MKNNIVFFTMSIVPRVDKRIKDFINRGYNVKVYSFGIKDEYINKDKAYTVEILDEGYRIAYIKRLLKYIPIILKKIKEHRIRGVNQFYFFSLNVALAALAYPKLRYIYEESDMLFDRSNYKLMRKVLKYLNIKVIKKSDITVFTSEGFSNYYFGNNVPNNIMIIPNKVSPDLLKQPNVNKKNIDFSSLKFGFVGFVRYYTLYNFARVLAMNYKNHEFHFYGKSVNYTKEETDNLTALGNVFFHGEFKNPSDLPEIYSKLDFVVATYDVRGLNPRFAEPNKIYESIFFRTPIIVSSNSFLSDKVEKLKIGFSVDPLNDVDIIAKLSKLTEENYLSYINSLDSIPLANAVDNNDIFFDRISDSKKTN